MKTLTPELRALLTTGDFVYCDLHEFALIGGQTLRYSTSDFSDILWDGHTYLSSANGPLMERKDDHAKVRWTRGLEVDTLDFDVIARDGDMIGSVTFMASIDAGAFDGAVYSLSRAFFPSWRVGGFLPMTLAPTGVVLMFPGTIVEVGGGRSRIRMSANSFKERLALQMPRKLFQAACLHTLYDVGCTLNKASFTDTGTITAVLSQNAFETDLTGQADAYYTLGAVIFSSGRNEGYSRSVKAYLNANGRVTTLSPIPFTPVAGDTFSIYPGCDKTQGTCAAKFANIANFLATPFVPAPEVAV